jgi:hypothetical protein
MVVIRLLKALGILLAVLILVVGVCLLRPEHAGMTQEPLVTGSWADGGEGPCFGSAEGPDGQRHGPASFAVDTKGRLFVADTYGHRVMVFDAAGEPAGELPLPKGFACSDLTVDALGGLYLVDGQNARLLKLNPAGEVLWEAPMADTPGGGSSLTAIEFAVAAPRGELYLLGHVLHEDRYRRKVTCVEAAGTETMLAVREMTPAGRSSAPEGVLDVFARGLAVDPHGHLYLHVQEPGEDGGKLLVLSGRRQVGEISLAGLELPVPVRLAGIDRQGRVYLTTVNPADPLKLWVLDRRGKLLTTRELHSPGPVLLRVSVRVGARGDVYTARSTRHGMEYTAWRPLIRPRLFRALLNR